MFCFFNLKSTIYHYSFFPSENDLNKTFFYYFLQPFFSCHIKKTCPNKLIIIFFTSSTPDLIAHAPMFVASMT